MTPEILAAYTVEHGGGTFRANGEPYEPTDGYAVGVARGSAAILPADATPQQLYDAVTRVAQEYDARFIGTWVMDDGRISVDPVRILTNKYAALDLGQQNGQQAIYGFAERVAIEVYP